MTICSSCARGNHQHDTWTGDREGQDAGCPNAVDGRECTCPVVLPPQPVKRCPTCGQKVRS